MKAKFIASATAAISLVRRRPTHTPTPTIKTTPAPMRRATPNGMVILEISSSAKPAAASVTVIKVVTRTVVAEASFGLIGASPHTGQTLRKSGGH